MQFKTVAEIVAFAGMSVTNQSKLIATAISVEIKKNGKSFYFYNKETKLWEEKDIDSLFSVLSMYFGNVDQHIRAICDKANVKPYCCCELRDSNCNCSGNQIRKLISLIDQSKYIRDIEARIADLITDNNFIKLLNAMPNMYPLKNGKKIDLKTLKITDRTALDYFTFESNCQYVKETPKADTFFKEIMPDKENRKYLQKILGYCITGETLGRVFFCVYGSGSNGKTLVFGKILKTILNELYHTCDKAVFVKSSYTGGASPHLYALVNKRVAVYSEGETADDMDINMTVIKGISGEDEISARGLYKDPITFQAKCKLILLTNYVPPMDAEKATKDRLRYIFFDQDFQDNPKEGQKIRDPVAIDNLIKNHFDEIFSWVVKGAKLFYEDSKIDMPEEFKQRTEQILEGEDSIASFFKHGLKFTDDKKDYIRKNVLFEVYKNYCNQNSQRCQPRSTLYNRLTHMKYSSTKLNGYDVYRNMKLVLATEIDDEDYNNGIDKTDQSVKPTAEYLKAQIKQLQLQLEQLEQHNYDSDEEDNHYNGIITIDVFRTSTKENKTNKNLIASFEKLLE